MSEGLSEANERVEGSLVTNTAVVRPGDWLKLQGVRADGGPLDADIAVLDAHDPRAEVVAQQMGLNLASRPEAAAARLMGILLVREGRMDQHTVLPAHHHILIRINGDDGDLLSAGLNVGEGSVPQLLFPHVTIAHQAYNLEYLARLEVMFGILSAAQDLQLRFVSDHEELSATPEAAEYMDHDGGLKR